jgi:hypothetical protein
MLNKIFFLFILSFIILTAHIFAQNLQITNITPNANQNHVTLDTNISIDFDRNINTATLNDTTVFVSGGQSGKLNGVFSGGGTSSITFNPDNDFRSGETISVTLTTDVMSDSGFTLARGFTYSFTAVSGSSPATPMALAQRDISGVSSQGEDIKTLDYDGDGDLDILSSSEGTPEQIYFLENNGNMEFCKISTGGNFRNVEVYDIDGDGDYDNFGATGAFNRELNWFENEGTFPLTERFISSEDPWTLAGGDLDSDGDIDVVAAVISPNRVLWFANDGDGNFSAAMTIPTTFGGGSDSYFYIRDIDSDGAMDILAFHRDDFNLVWYENDGNQNFTEHLIANTPNRMRLASGDIDDDGDIDIIAVSTDGNPTSAILGYENDGSENFIEYTFVATTTGRLYTTAITDLDGDLDMDILAGGYWFENDGSEVFTEKTISDGLKLGDNYFANGISFADMDADGDMDIVTLGLYSTSWHENNQFMEITSTLPGNSAVSFAADANISVTFDQYIDGATINTNDFRVFSQSRGQIDGTFSGGGTNTITFDPVSDFLPGEKIEVSINEKVHSTSGHSLFFNYGFTFQTQSSIVDQPAFSPLTIITHTNNVTGMDVADIDSDGDLDMVSCSWSELFWHENDGSGNFTSIPITSNATPVGIFAFDQNGDGFTDIWVDNSGFNSSMLYTNDGNQNFTEGPITGALSLKQLTDLNHDGDTDIIFLSRSNNWLYWNDYRCDGYGGLGYIPQLANHDVQVGDMDNDGDNDFITATSSGPLFYENNNYFIYSNLYFDTNNTNSIFLSDLDSDGDLDPIFTESYSAIIWYENRLTGDSLDFGDRQEIAPLNMDPRDVIAVDIDGDDDADIAAVSRNDDKVVWYENRLNEPTADFGPEQLGVTITDGPIAIQSADMDNDGDMDLVTLSGGDDELIWFQNSGNASGIDDEETITPLVFKLHQNYPNPFNPVTTIKYDLPDNIHVRLELFNSLGQQVGLLVNENKVAGNHSVVFNVTHLPSGIYYYRINTAKYTRIRKMIFLK